MKKMLKKILKRYLPFLPPILLKFAMAARNKLRFFSSIHKHEKIGDTIFILGNGPSLKEQLEKSCDTIASYPCVCVNSFVSTDFYKRVKPCMYLLMDPAYFIPMTKIKHTHETEVVRNAIENTWNDLHDKTEWNITLVVPTQFKENERLKQLRTNFHITILFCNMRDCSIYLNKKDMFKLFNKNKLASPAQTVINTAVYLAIFWKYKKVILLGADTSLHEDLLVDQKTNLLYTEDKHFYNSKRQIAYKNVEQGTVFKLHEFLYAIGKMFENYQLLREYADYNSVSIFNASAKSWIDAFERRTLGELMEVPHDK